MAPSSTANATKAPLKKTTKTAERKILPKKRQPLGQLEHNSRQVKAKQAEVIALSTEDDHDLPSQKALSCDERPLPAQAVRPFKLQNKQLVHQGRKFESVEALLLDLVAARKLNATEASELGEGMLQKQGNGKGKARVVEEDVSTASGFTVPQIKLQPPSETRHTQVTPRIILPPPVMSPATNVQCGHGFTKYQSIPVDFGALNLARGDKPYAGDRYIDKLVGNDVERFKKWHLECQWRRSEERENHHWPAERFWQG